LIAYCSPYFINPKALNWGGRYCFIWAGSNAAAWRKSSARIRKVILPGSNTAAVFFYFFIPEVKGRSLEEIDELFSNRVAVKDFPKYETVSAVRAHEAALEDLGMEPKRVETVEVVDKTENKV
jgi:hypothetical protein